MTRTIFSSDHEAFRSTVRTFLERSVIPNLEEYAEVGVLPREFWLEAGEIGLLGLEVPETYASRHPRRPQPRQSRPCQSIVMWPSSLPLPNGPRKRRLSTTTPPPTPVEIVR